MITQSSQGGRIIGGFVLGEINTQSGEDGGAGRWVRRGWGGFTLNDSQTASNPCWWITKFKLAEKFVKDLKTNNLLISRRSVSTVILEGYP